ncbi:GNAT family N-acetyltransferase [Aquirhabdus parva]|uniref:GNAT family N-acetyltransferase n=1 Tax=Aquirhabdus parva TaxID=2283318 RepID=A0A345P669_9GAMM|nr:GNAT family N-acetyltransferase [Aquirhabdus parva]AXI02778.1 GNAT family N-acetyltransferase [Aquirhabdus parva]
MLSLRQLSASNPQDIDALLLLFEQASDYFHIIEDRPPEYNDAYLTLTELPLLKGIEDKRCMGFYLDHLLVGCIDMIRGYPETHIAYLGLILFSENYQRQGLGKKGVEYATQMSKSWGCTMLRLAVIETNQLAFSFWQRQGFKEIYRKSLLQYTGQAIVMERHI